VEVRVCPASLLSATRKTSLPIVFQTTSSLEATWKSSLQEIALDPEEYSRGLPGYFTSPRIESIETVFVTIGETYPRVKVINPLWAVTLEKVKEAWRSTGSMYHPPSPSSLPQAHWCFASFANLPSPERRAQAFLGESVKWTETQSILDKQTVETLPPKLEDQQAPQEESVKERDSLATKKSPLKSFLDPIPVSESSLENFGHKRRGRIAAAPAWWSRFKTACPLP